LFSGYFKLIASVSLLLCVPLFVIGTWLHFRTHTRFALGVIAWWLIALGTTLVLGPITVLLVHLIIPLI
jgi:hypothetical protein